MRPTDVILRFLDSLGRASDGQFYLGLFHSLPRESFAILAVDGEVTHDAADALALDLRYLTQLDLYPTLLFGLLDSAGASRHAPATATALERSGVASARLDANPATLAASIRAAVREGTVPLVAFDDDTPEAARFDWLTTAVRALKTRKLIFVRRDGRLGHRREDRISVVNLTTDYDRLVLPGVLPPDQVELLRAVRQLLCERLEHRVLAAVTSPMNLLKELFTVKGGGTLIKRGSGIQAYGSLADVDIERLRQLLESSFKKRLGRAFFSRAIERLYLEEGYRGAAMVAATPAGHYLTKFAVDAQAQGEGLGRDLWQVLTTDYPRLFWRCRPENAILPFYQKACDGMARFPSWHVFWIGVPPADLAATIDYATQMPEDFTKAGA